MLKGRPICVLNMVAENDVLIQTAQRVLEGRPICVLNMVAENDVLIQTAQRVL